MQDKCTHKHIDCTFMSTTCLNNENFFFFTRKRFFQLSLRRRKSITVQIKCLVRSLIARSAIGDDRYWERAYASCSANNRCNKIVKLNFILNIEPMSKYLSSPQAEPASFVRERCFFRVLFNCKSNLYTIMTPLRIIDLLRLTHTYNIYFYKS